MPARNALKKYVENGVYHIYNRGVEKRDIFLDSNDYRYFLWLLKTYLSPAPKGILPSEGESLQRWAFDEEIDLLAYCLMPNHFHLLIKQKSKGSMTRFMRCLATNYSMKFNKKYDRTGTLFQGPYKAVLVEDDNYLLHLTRYIHLNPGSKGRIPFEGRSLDSKWSSYGDYLGVRNTKWVKLELVLGILGQEFGGAGEGLGLYKNFVKEYSTDSAEILGKLTLES